MYISLKYIHNYMKAGIKITLLLLPFFSNNDLVLYIANYDNN